MLDRNYHVIWGFHPDLYILYYFKNKKKIRKNIERQYLFLFLFLFILLTLFILLSYTFFYVLLLSSPLPMAESFEVFHTILLIHRKSGESIEPVRP